MGTRRFCGFNERDICSSSASRTRSLSGVTPLHSLQNKNGLPSSCSVEEARKALVILDQIVLSDKSKSSQESSTGRFEAVKDFCYRNVPMLGQVCEKIGGAANSQKPAAGGTTRVNGADLCKEVSAVLTDFGQLHYVGAFLVILGFALDRIAKASKYLEGERNELQFLSNFGRHVFRIYGHVKDDEDLEVAEPLHRAMELICKYATVYGEPQLKRRSLCGRFWCVETDLDGLASLRKQVEDLYKELDLIAMDQVPKRVLKSISTWATGENFTISTETRAELVGTEKPVEESLNLLKAHNLSNGVHSLVLVGAPGSGKGLVGLQVAAKVKMERNFNEIDCCKINMYEGGDCIKVGKKQKELYAKLSRGEERKFSGPLDGRLILDLLFRRREQPCLIYLHNAHEPDDVDQLLPDGLDKCLPSGSILIVTTANEAVIYTLEMKGVRCSDYSVRELGKDDALTLFMRRIVRDPNASPSSELWRKLMQHDHELLSKLLEFCNGVPMLLIVVGNSIWTIGHDYLRNHFEGLPTEERHQLAMNFNAAYRRLAETSQVSASREFLKKLKAAAKHVHTSLVLDQDPIGKRGNCNDMRLRRSLRFACDQLKKNDQMQEFFEDIVAVHLGRKCEDIKMICGPEASIHLNRLKQMSMVKHVIQENSDGTFEAVLQVGGLLAGEARKMDDTDQPGRRLIVDNINRAPTYMRKAKYSPVYAQPEIVKLVQCGNLQSKFPFLHIDLSKLQYLELVGTDITEELLEGSEALPPSLKFLRVRNSCLPFLWEDFPQLVFLDLDLQKMPGVKSFQSMPNLQELKLENSTSLTWLGPLPKLKTAHVKNCPNFEEIKGMEQVSELKILNCPKFLLSCISNLGSLRRLSLGFGFTGFPEGCVIPAGVESVSLSGNVKMVELPTFAQGAVIKRLDLRFCCGLELSWDTLSSVIPNLEELYLGECLALEQFPSLPELFPKLKVVDVWGCPDISPRDLFDVAKKLHGRDPPIRIIGEQVEDANVHSGCGGLFLSFSRRKFEAAKSSFRRCKHGYVLLRRLTFPPRRASMEKNKTQ